MKWLERFFIARKLQWFLSDDKDKEMEKRCNDSSHGKVEMWGKILNN